MQKEAAEKSFFILPTSNFGTEILNFYLQFLFLHILVLIGFQQLHSMFLDLVSNQVVELN